MYANPKGGSRGHVARDGAVEAWESPSVHSTSPDALAEEILAAYLYRGRPVAFCCAGAGLRLAGTRPIIGPPDVWRRLPQRDYRP